MRRESRMPDSVQMWMPDNGGTSGGSGFADGGPESPKPSDKPKKAWSTKKIVIVAALGALALILIGVAAWIWSIMSDPLAQFSNVAEQFSPEPVAAGPGAAVEEPDDPDDPEPVATPTVDPYQALLSQADTGFLKDIVNIMLIGVDHSVERETWRGKKAFHADVMIVLAINKNTGAVNMISLPRDTYAQIPGVKGIYKLNASLDCGGGWPSEANGYSTGGFDKVCEAASWMLGGIPVQYYYAVDMGAVKGLVDAIGGVQDFDVDFDFTMQGRSYKKGVQDMDGQAVLDYLRVRKGIAEAGDLNRINRQKKMLVAIFDKIQKKGLLTSIPGLLDSFEGNLYTNTNLAQTAALAAFAYNVNPDSIGMYSMGGRSQNIFNWNFVLTDQQARVKLIKQIYGVDVEPYKDYTAAAATARWNRMQLPVVRRQAASVLDKVKAKLDADAALPIEGATPTPPVETPKPPPVTSEPPAETSEPPAETSEPPAETPEPPAETPDPGSSGASGMTLLCMGTGGVPRFAAASAGYRKYLPGGREWSLYNKARSELNNLSASTQKIEQLKADIEALCSIFGISRPSWRVNFETSYNEIDVDFR